PGVIPQGYSDNPPPATLNFQRPLQLDTSQRPSTSFSQTSDDRMKYSYGDLAGMIDHSLLHPTMTDAELKAGCEIAARYKVASVCIKPYAVKQAVEWLRGSGVKVGAVIGFPHGNPATESKRYETGIACRDGAGEIDK